MGETLVLVVLRQMGVVVVEGVLVVRCSRARASFRTGGRVSRRLEERGSQLDRR
jgi:hypothetical protein